MYETFWYNFDRLRLASGKTITDVETNIGVTIGRLKIIREYRQSLPGWQIIERLADEFDVHFSEFYKEIWHG